MNIAFTFCQNSLLATNMASAFWFVLFASL